MSSSSQQQAKGLNTDRRSKNRFRFTSSKERGRQASADVYRKRRRGESTTIGASSREERVHCGKDEYNGGNTANGHQKARKRSRAFKDGADGDGKQAVVLARPKKDSDDGEVVGATLDLSDSDSAGGESASCASSSNFASELDIAFDRNGSQIFAAFHREVWHLVRSLPELLHHADKVVDVLLRYMLSPAAAKGEEGENDDESSVNNATVDDDRLDDDEENEAEKNETKDADAERRRGHRRRRYVVNDATTDILHLIAVLGRDLLHEIHPYLHSKIMPRILYDLISPPPPVPTTKHPQQPIPVDVTVVETAFRTLAYLFRYDAGPLLEEACYTDDNKNGDGEPCLEPMRKYYGVVLAHRRDVVRRLGAEAFAPLIRKLKSDGAKKRHLKRVLRAFVTASGTHQQQSSPAPALKRLQDDAVDGISQLMFQVCKGVHGRLHSKGSIAIKCVLDSFKGSQDDDANKIKLLERIASKFFDHLCRFLDRPSASDVLRTVLRSAQSSITSTKSAHHCQSFLQIARQMIIFRDGFLIKGKEEENNDSLPLAEELFHVLEKLLKPTIFCELTRSCQNGVIKLLCLVLKSVPGKNDLVARAGRQVQCVLSSFGYQTAEPMSDDEGQPVASIAAILATDLLPYVSPDIGMEAIGSAIAAAAAGIAERDRDCAVSLVHSILMSTRNTQCEESNDDKDCTFNLNTAALCMVSASEKSSLLEACLVSPDFGSFSEGLCSQLAVAAQCASFIGLLRVRNVADKKNLPKCYEKVSNWLLSLLDIVSSDKQYRKGEVLEPSMGVLYSIVLESCALYMEAVLLRLDQSAIMNDSPKHLEKLAAKHLIAKPESIWTVKSVSSIVLLFQKLGISLNVDGDSVFGSLTPNLRRPSHFLRLHTLQILASLPSRPFVVDHADLDLSCDLDEEPSSGPIGGMSERRQGPTGMCDIMKTLLKIESTPLSLDQERHIVAGISRIEVLGRTGRLPVSHAEAAGSHLLGLLHAKFAPVWPAAVKAIVALSGGHEQSTWPSIQHAITEVTLGRSSIEPTKCLDGDGDGMFVHSKYFELCLQWEKSNGIDSRLFGQVVNPSNRVRGSRFECTDESAVFESLWKIMEVGSNLMTTHSRSIVPIFLKFMLEQFYSGGGDDPDAREMRLVEHVVDRCGEIER